MTLSVGTGIALWAVILLIPGTGWDAHVYWSAGLAHPYVSSLAGAAGAPGAYLYSPVFRQVLEPLALLPWPVFHALWLALLIGLIVLLTGPLAIVVLLNPIMLIELAAGNIHVLLATAIVFGFRYPATWAFVLLTKVTPGVGVLWFLVRREWRNLAVVAVATLAVSAASFLLAPGLWVEWAQSLVRNASIPASDYTGAIFGPLWLRGLVAAAIVTWGGLTNRRWTVPVAATLAIPLLAYFNLSLLVALVPLALPAAVPYLSRWLAARGQTTASAVG